MIQRAAKQAVRDVGLSPMGLCCVAILITSAAGMRAETPIKYLPPEAFDQLPGRIVKKLHALGCLVPQVPEDQMPNNVVSGQFLAAGQTAWAVLCSRRGTSSILVLAEKDATVKAELSRAPDKQFLLLGGSDAGGLCCFSRLLSVASPARIVSADKAYGNNPPLPPLAHDGIEDAFEGKASAIFYFHAGRWRELAGSD